MTTCTLNWLIRSCMCSNQSIHVRTYLFPIIYPSIDICDGRSVMLYELSPLWGSDDIILQHLSFYMTSICLPSEGAGRDFKLVWQRSKDEVISVDHQPWNAVCVVCVVCVCLCVCHVCVRVYAHVCTCVHACARARVCVCVWTIIAPKQRLKLPSMYVVARLCVTNALDVIMYVYADKHLQGTILMVEDSSVKTMKTVLLENLALYAIQSALNL